MRNYHKDPESDTLFNHLTKTITTLSAIFSDENQQEISSLSTTDALLKITNDKNKSYAKGEQCKQNKLKFEVEAGIDSRDFSPQQQYFEARANEKGTRDSAVRFSPPHSHLLLLPPSYLTFPLFSLRPFLTSFLPPIIETGLCLIFLVYVTDLKYHQRTKKLL